MPISTHEMSEQEYIAYVTRRPRDEAEAREMDAEDQALLDADIAARWRLRSVPSPCRVVRDESGKVVDVMIVEKN